MYIYIYIYIYMCRYMKVPVGALIIVGLGRKW